MEGLAIRVMQNASLHPDVWFLSNSATDTARERKRCIQNCAFVTIWMCYRYSVKQRRFSCPLSTNSESHSPPPPSPLTGASIRVKLLHHYVINMALHLNYRRKQTALCCQSRRDSYPQGLNAKKRKRLADYDFRYYASSKNSTWFTRCNTVHWRRMASI